jgi:hypothetical protein
MLTGQKGEGKINLHKNCFACGSNNGMGLGLKFYKHEDGTQSLKAIRESSMEEL